MNKILEVKIMNEISNIAKKILGNDVDVKDEMESGCIWHFDSFDDVVKSEEGETYPLSAAQLRARIGKQLFKLSDGSYVWFEGCCLPDELNKETSLEDMLDRALDIVERPDSAEYMAEKLMYTDTTWNMFESLASDWLNGSKEFRKGLNDAVILMTGYSLETMAEELLKKYKIA